MSTYYVDKHRQGQTIINTLFEKNLRMEVTKGYVILLVAKCMWLSPLIYDINHGSILTIHDLTF